MRKKQIDLFFRKLGEELDTPCEVILVGASAGSLMGHIRPSFDIDFEIRCRRKTRKLKTLLPRVIDQAAEFAGVAVNFSENVGGWSMINYLDYRKTAVVYKKFGKIKVKIIAPEYWTIGKMARFLKLDIEDMVQLVRRKKLKPERLIKIWAKALLSSDLSLELGQFRDHVVYFLKTCSKRIWGKSINSGKLINSFLRQIQ